MKFQTLTDLGEVIGPAAAHPAVTDTQEDTVLDPVHHPTDTNARSQRENAIQTDDMLKVQAC